MSDNWYHGEDEDDDRETLPRRPRERDDPGAVRIVGGTPRSAGEWLPAPERPTAYVPRAAGPAPQRPGPPPGPARPVSSPPPAPASGLRRGNSCVWILALVAVVVLACGVLGAGAIQNGVSGLTGWLPGLPGLPFVTPTVIIQPQGPSVIEEIQALSRLETARYTIEKVLSGESTGALPPFTSDKILFVAHGDVTAGVDLGKLTDADVQVLSGTVTISLPPSEILNSRLDNDKSYVYDRQTGLFTKADPQLESQIRQRAEKEIVDAALEDGILGQAQNNAEVTLRALLRGLHYDTVVFVTRSPRPATTPAGAGDQPAVPSATAAP